MFKLALALLATLGTAHAADIEPHWHPVGDIAPGLEVDLGSVVRANGLNTAIWRSTGMDEVVMITLAKDCAPNRKFIKYTLASDDGGRVHEVVRRGSNTVMEFMAEFVCGTAK